MVADSDDCLRSIIDLQKTLYDHHTHVNDELSQIKKAFHERISPLEEKVARQTQLIDMALKGVTYIFPSGIAITALAWLAGLFNHH